MRLLVSVVSAAEARAAVAGGAAIIDVKDPRIGPLGAAVPDIIRSVRAAVPAHLPVSAALGDLPHMPGTAALAAAGAALAGAAYVKVGLLDPSPAAARQLLLAAVAGAAQGAPGTRVVAVAYADAAAIGALPPHALPAAARAAGCAGAMLDTYQKGPGNLLTWQDWDSLAGFLAACRAAGLWGALAGSLSAELVGQAAALCPDIIGVRGAACAGGRRTGRVTADRVRTLAALCQGQNLAAAAAWNRRAGTPGRPGDGP